MRILPTALAISAVLHTSAIAYVVSQKPAHIIEVPDTGTGTEITIEEPMAVALLDDHTPVAAATTTSPPSNTSTAPNAPHLAHVSTGSHRGTEAAAGKGTTGPTGEQHGPRNGLMTMRHPEISNGVGGDFLDRFLANSKELDPETVALRQDETAIDKGKDPHGIRHDGPGYKAEDKPYDAIIEPDGTTHLKDKPTFDATDALMRRHGIDPYASKKLKWLDETREERYRIGKQYKHELLGKSAQLARKNLEWMWTKLTSTAERKQALFDLWDEIAETGPDDVVAAGIAARAQIIGFVRARLTGADAYTATELERFNGAKKSTATFDPYRE